MHRVATHRLQWRYNTPFLNEQQQHKVRDDVRCLTLLIRAVARLVILWESVGSFSERTIYMMQGGLGEVKADPVDRPGHTWLLQLQGCHYENRIELFHAWSTDQAWRG